MFRLITTYLARAARTTKRRSRRLPPAVMALEGRTLLSSFTVHGKPDDGHTPAAAVSMLRQTHSGTSVNDHGGGVENTGSQLALARVVPPGHSARGGGGPLASHKLNDKRRGLSRSGRGATGLVLSDDFNGTGGVPKNWTMFGSGVVTEKPKNLTLTDTSGQSVGIVSMLKTSVFSPQGVTTTIKAQIKSLSTNPVGNGVVGILGVPNSNGSTGELAAGIDSTGVVFIVVQQQNPTVDQTIMPIGTVKGYNGGPILLTFKISSSKGGVTVSAGSFTSNLISFSDLNKNFSLKNAFGNDAIPALVGASQQNQKGGSASFSSISVSTAVEKRR